MAGTLTWGRFDGDPLSALALIVLALSMPAANANVGAQRGGDELASFKSASCKKGSKKLLSFTALAKSGGWSCG